MVKGQVSGSNFDGVFNPLYCEEEIQDKDNPPNGHANQDIKQGKLLFTQCTQPIQ